MEVLCPECQKPLKQAAGLRWLCFTDDCPLHATSVPGGTKHRHGNRNYQRVEADGHEFGSIGEFHRYLELKTAQDNGEIRNLTCHTKYRLQISDDRPLLLRSGKYPKGVPATWTDDFSYEELFDVGLETEGWRLVVEDFKGRDTYQERFKRGVFEMLTGIQVRVTYAKSRRPQNERAAG